VIPYAYPLTKSLTSPILSRRRRMTAKNRRSVHAHTQGCLFGQASRRLAICLPTRTLTRNREPFPPANTLSHETAIAICAVLRLRAAKDRPAILGRVCQNLPLLLSQLALAPLLLSPRERDLRRPAAKSAQFEILGGRREGGRFKSSKNSFHSLILTG
jgi:hypothetical protein